MWLVLARKGTTSPTRLTYDEALERGAVLRLDRRPAAQSRRCHVPPALLASSGAQPVVGANAEIVARLIADGRMRQPGMAEVERAMSDGQVGRPPTQGRPGSRSRTTLPPRSAPEPRAPAMFAILTSQNRYAILLRTGSAKRADTRARRIEAFVEMLERGETIYPQKRTLDS